MDPLTHEYLDRMMVGMVPIDLGRLIAAARASIPRPIADAPRDGTFIIARIYGLDMWAKMSWNNAAKKWQSINRLEDYDPIEFISIPKGGASC